MVASPLPSPGPLVVSDWDLVSGAIIPGLAIILSTAIAVLLFVAERRSSRNSRQQERQDKLLEEILSTLAFFVSVNPLAESWAAEWRKLRSQVTLLQTLPSPRARLLGEWLALAIERKSSLLAEAMFALDAFPGEVDPAFLLNTMRPAHDWAAYCINSIASWMRGDVDDDRIREGIAELRPSTT